MDDKPNWRLFNVDDMVKELSDSDPVGPTIDLYVASLAYKNFDFISKRLPHVIECSTYNPLAWLQMLDSASARYWIQEKNEGVAVYAATEHCGCVRTYRLNVDHPVRAQKQGRQWVVLPNEKTLYSLLDSASARAIFKAWHHWTTQANEHATALAEGRFKNTSVGQSLIISSGLGCVVCAAPAVAHASTTIGLAASQATLVQLPLCAMHLEEARAEPNVLAFISKMFSLSLDLPESNRTESIPDAMITEVHQIAANELGGTIGTADKRNGNWILKIELPTGWHWVLRLRTLMDYAYMLFRPGDDVAVYRADSAPHHTELPFFPDHEHSRPDRKKDVTAPSFLYGTPIFDLKRLRTVSQDHKAL